MPISAPTLKLPAIVYADLNGNPQQLNFAYAPKVTSPMTPAHQGAQTVASDGTMWSVWFYRENYIEMTCTMLLGPDMTAWMAFLDAAPNGQILTFYPDQFNAAFSAQMRLMGGQQSQNSSSSNAPTGSPKFRRAGFGRFESDLVFRLENPAQAAALYNALNGL